MPVTDLVQVGCLLTRAQHERLKQLSRETHLSMSAYLRAALEHLLAEQARKKSHERRGEVP